jgi:FG-GAP repeat protein
MMHPALRRSFALALLLLLCLPARVFAAGAVPAAVGSGAGGDFDGDGFADLAVGVPGDDSAEANAGAVNVIRGGARGLTSSGDQLWTEDTPGLPGGADPGEAFGSALAVGDFNADGFADLAAGAPRDQVGIVPAAGAVVVLYGSPVGLRQAGSQQWTQDSPGVPGRAARNNLFGAAVASGDFNGDGFGDLSVSAPQQRVGATFSAGSVTVLYGSPVGLRTPGSRMFTQATRGIGGRPGNLHLFGWSIAAADFGRGRARDLAIGVPLDGAGGKLHAGSVVVLYGSASGLRASGSQRWTQARPGVVDDSEAGDLFGWSLAAADLGRTSESDVAVGVPGEDLGAVTDAGAVNVLFGGARGLRSGGSQFRTQDSPGIQGRAQSGDAFGSALAAADFGRNAHADLAVGVPAEEVRPKGAAGAVNVIYGSRTGLTRRANHLWTRDSPGVLGTAQRGERFGEALAAERFGRSRLADLAVGIPRHNPSRARGAGAVAVLYGSYRGLRPAGNQLWTRASSGISGTATRGDHFGHTVA